MSNITQQQQFEQLTDWLKQNKLFLITVLIFIFGGVFGFNYWQHHQAKKEKKLVDDYALTEIAFMQKKDQASLDEFAKKYPDTIYTKIIYMEKAKAEIQAGGYKNAITSLESALKHSKDEVMDTVINLNLAKLNFQLANYQQAINVLTKVTLQEFLMNKNILLGDIYAQQKNIDKAKNYYDKALLGLSTTSREYEIIKWKLKNL